MMPHRTIQRSGSSPDPAGRTIPLVLNVLLYCFLSWLLSQACAAFLEYHIGKQWPLFLSTFRMFTFLPIHEAGHFFFSPFGRTLTILGGSFLQIALPLAWFILAILQRSSIAPFPLFWVGENMMDVSLYMRDAPVRMIPLLGGDTSGHDWFNLFRQWNLLEYAEVVADYMFYGGVAVAAAAIAAGFIVAFVMYTRAGPSFAVQESDTSGDAREIEDLLDTSLEMKHRGEISGQREDPYKSGPAQ